MDPLITEILSRFGLKADQVRKPSDAKLTQVYLVEDRYVLRARPFEADTVERFAAERALYGHVAELTGFRFPQYRHSIAGTDHVIEGDGFWTLHGLIPGRPLGSWFALHRVAPSVNREVFGALRRLHSETAGCFDEKTVDRSRLLELVAPALDAAPGFLNGPPLARLKTAYNRVTKFCGSYPFTNACFVHGDFHHGNILSDRGRIVGFIDLDWCRVGSPYEDLGFTLMMQLRDYAHWTPALRWPVYHEMLDFYGFDGDKAILNDHLILYALFDCGVFKEAGFENAPTFFEYQKRFLEAVCLQLPVS